VLPSTQYQVLGTKDLVPGTRYLVPTSWYNNTQQWEQLRTKVAICRVQTWTLQRTKIQNICIPAYKEW